MAFDSRRVPIVLVNYACLFDTHKANKASFYKFSFLWVVDASEPQQQKNVHCRFH